MLQAIFHAYNGISAWSSRFKDVVHNASNIDQPGYKGRSTTNGSFYDLGRYYNPYTSNHANSNTNWSDGKHQSESGDTSHQNLSVHGDGWFVLKNGNNIIYTRDGQFRIDNQGLFHSLDMPDARLQALTTDGKLYDFRKIFTTNQAQIKATENIEVDGGFYYLTSDDIKQASDALSHDAKSFAKKIIVHDGHGSEYQLALTFTYNLQANPGAVLEQSWKLSINGLPEGSCKILNDLSQPFQDITIFDGLMQSSQPTLESQNLQIITERGENLDIVLNFSPNSIQQYHLNATTPGTKPFISDVVDDLITKAENSTSLPDSLSNQSENEHAFYIDQKGSIIYPYGQYGHADTGDTMALAMLDTSNLHELEFSPGYYTCDGVSDDVYHTARQLGSQIIRDEIELSNVSAENAISDLLSAEQMLQGNSAVLQVTDQLIKNLYQLHSNKN